MPWMTSLHHTSYTASTASACWRSVSSKTGPGYLVRAATSCLISFFWAQLMTADILFLPSTLLLKSAISGQGLSHFVAVINNSCKLPNILVDIQPVISHLNSTANHLNTKSLKSLWVCINRAIVSRQGGLDLLWCISTLHLGLVSTQWKQQ